MRKLFILFIMVWPSFGFSQTLFGPHITVGYNDGFHSDIGLDLSFIRLTEGGFGDLIKKYRAVQNFLGFEYDRINDTKIYGPKYRIAGHYKLFVLGVDAAYLSASDSPDWFLVVRPQVGIGIFTVFTLNYTYNLSSKLDLYPSGYSPHGFSLGLTLPLHDGNGWRFSDY